MLQYGDLLIWSPLLVKKRNARIAIDNWRKRVSLAKLG